MQKKMDTVLGLLKLGNFLKVKPLQDPYRKLKHIFPRRKKKDRKCKIKRPVWELMSVYIMFLLLWRNTR